MCTHNQCFKAKKKKMIINIFTAVKYCCILHGCVCLMKCGGHYANMPIQYAVILKAATNDDF